LQQGLPFINVTIVPHVVITTNMPLSMVFTYAGGASSVVNTGFGDGFGDGFVVRLCLLPKIDS
jgi:hypothetical protein